MAWKPKEKELTPEEALDLAKRELAPFWHGSSPLVAGFQGEQGFQAFPLHPDFPKQSWLFFFIDPTHLSATTYAEHSAQFHERYREHGLHVALVLKGQFEYLKEKVVVERLIEEWDIEFPIVIDTEGALAGSFGVDDQACAVLLDQLQIRWRKLITLKPALETAVQEFLRIKDPGLPLPPPAEIEGTIVHQVMELNLKDVPLEPHDLPKGLSGEWRKEEDRFCTSDPKATYTFTPMGQTVSLVVQSLTALIEPVRISIQVNGKPAKELWGNDRLSSDEEGRSIARIKDPGAYTILDHSAIVGTQIQLEFFAADKVPLALYGVRSGSPISR